VWEGKAAEFFRHEVSTCSDVLHGVMVLVCCVCFGDPDVVKQSMRDATPKVLMACSALLGHIQQFAVVLEAETRFRDRELAADWTLQAVDGKLVVRSEFKAVIAGGMEH
jgi:hypothetical protein